MLTDKNKKHITSSFFMFYLNLTLIVILIYINYCLSHISCVVVADGIEPKSDNVVIRIEHEKRLVLGHRARQEVVRTGVAIRIDRTIQAIAATPTGRQGRVSGTYEKVVRGLPYIVAYALGDEGGIRADRNPAIAQLGGTGGGT